MPTIIGIGRRNMAKKLSNKGKEALAFKVMCAASDMGEQASVTDLGMLPPEASWLPNPA
jgi:hypothetical protein